jgi:hypothetical protein
MRVTMYGIQRDHGARSLSIYVSKNSRAG